MQVVLQFILSMLYEYSAGLSWAVLSYPSADPRTNCLNVASPSLSSEYWISTFRPYDRPVFVGVFPAWAEYSSLSAYDSQGEPIPGTTVSSAQTTGGTIDLMAGVANVSAFELPYAVIHRVYRPPNRTQCLRDSEKFEVRLGGVAQPLASETQARDSGKELEPQLQKALGKIHPDIRPDTPFYKPSTRDFPGLFPNADATYLVSSPSRQTAGMRIEGCRPDAAPWIKYLGFMTTDLYTTATDASMEVHGCYTVFAMTLGEDPASYGYDAANASQHLITWNADVFPTLVMRIVDVSCSLGACKYDLNQSHYVPWWECEAILGDVYPTTIFLDTTLN